MGNQLPEGYELHGWSVRYEANRTNDRIRIVATAPEREMIFVEISNANPLYEEILTQRLEEMVLEEEVRVAKNATDRKKYTELYEAVALEKRISNRVRGMERAMREQGESGVTATAE